MIRITISFRNGWTKKDNLHMTEAIEAICGTICFCAFFLYLYKIQQ